MHENLCSWFLSIQQLVLIRVFRDISCQKNRCTGFIITRRAVFVSLVVEKPLLQTLTKSHRILSRKYFSAGSTEVWWSCSLRVSNIWGRLIVYIFSYSLRTAKILLLKFEHEEEIVKKCSATDVHMSGRWSVFIAITRCQPTGRIKLINFDMLSQPRGLHPRAHIDYDPRSDIRVISYSAHNVPVVRQVWMFTTHLAHVSLFIVSKVSVFKDDEVRTLLLMSTNWPAN